MDVRSVDKDSKGVFYVIIHYCVGWGVGRGFGTGVCRGVGVEVNISKV